MKSSCREMCLGPAEPASFAATPGARAYPVESILRLHLTTTKSGLSELGALMMTSLSLQQGNPEGRTLQMLRRGESHQDREGYWERTRTGKAGPASCSRVLAEDHQSRSIP
jgi:hypothetical protein